MKRTVFSVIAAASSVVAGMDLNAAADESAVESTVKSVPVVEAAAPQAAPADVKGGMAPAPTAEAPAAAPTAVATAVMAPFEAFTGKVIKNKVRLRIEPHVESEIVRELNRNDLLIVVGEENSFYAIKPPSGTKAYVFRTFVLDGTIEGKRVNTRLKPDTNAPVIAQLNAGDKVTGTPYPLNSKWMEIEPPTNVKFYIAKEFVERVGDINYLSVIQKQRDEATKQINSTYLVGQSELRKPFEEINIDKVLTAFDKVIGSFSECPQEIERAKEMRQIVRDAYTQKKIAYLEGKANAPVDPKTAELTAQIENYQHRLQELEGKMKNEAGIASTDPAPRSKDNTAKDSKVASAPVAPQPVVTDKMAIWEPLEKNYFNEWASAHGEAATIQEFYEDQIDNAEMLTGIVEPFTKPVKNKPGDYILIDHNNRPLAYLYSTKVNLQQYIGKEVGIHVANRPNNHFAHPAYFVLSVE